MSSYLLNKPKRNTAPVYTPISTKQVKNNCGAFVYQISPEDQLRRFLVLGREGGTYYAGEHKLTADNTTSIKFLIHTNGKLVVSIVVEMSVGGRIPKNDTALYVLAMCSAYGDTETRAMAHSVLPQVARTGTHLFQFCAFVDTMRGWGRGLRTAVGNWYTEQEPSKLAYQVIKYGQRDGWSHADLLRLSHPRATGVTNDILKYTVDGWPNVGTDPHPDDVLALLWAAERVKATDSEDEIALLIQTYHLPMEVVPSEKKTKRVYEALLPDAPITWLLRNLGTLSKLEVLKTGQFTNINTVCDKLANESILRKGRVHPLAVMVAHNTYKSGAGIRGSSTWPVVQKVVDALDKSFELAFKTIDPTGKRILLALDVSGSMSMGTIAGMPGITPRIGAAAMAAVTVRAEDNVTTMAFSNTFMPFNIGKTETLDSVVRHMSSMSFSNTDCSLPIVWATRNNVEADAFVIYTDSETNCGVHPMTALKAYRDKMGIDAELIVVGMTATKFSIGDPNDPRILNVVGFDTSAPNIISEFIAS